MKKPFTLLIYLVSFLVLGLFGSLDAKAVKDPVSDNSLKKVLLSSTVSSSPWTQRYQSDAEVVSMRNRNMKHFKNASGSFTSFTSSGSIHYKQGSEWLEINNNIVANNSSLYPSKLFANTTNSFQTYYPANPFKEPVVVAYNGNVYQEIINAISFLDANGNKISSLAMRGNVTAQVFGNQLVYSGFYPGLDLIYTQNNDGKKVDLVIQNSTFLKAIPAQAAKIVIEESVILPAGLVVKEENGVTVYNGRNIEVNYPTPIATESLNTNKQYTNERDLLQNGNLILVGQKTNSIILQSQFDVNWLKDASRTFPVKLDPSANYGPFAVSMATGYMTTATGAKTNGLLRLASTNTFAWAKFDISGLAATGATGVDSARYWGYHYSTTGADKIAKIAGMGNVDPVSALNTAIVSQINAGPTYKNNYVFGGAAFQWRNALLDTTLADTAIFNSIARGWFSIGMTYLSGNATFMYQYGWNGIAGSICYLEVTYQTAPCTNPVSAGSVNGNALVCGGSSTTLSLTGASVGTGVTYQWQSSPDSLTWTNVVGAQSPSYSPVISSDSIYYRCQVICSAGTPAYTAAKVIYADVFVVTPTNPYDEGFEGITVNNQLPTCMAATNLGTLTTTYTAAAGSYNRFSRTGNKYGSFRYGCNDFFFTKGLKLTQGVTYSFSTWFVTDGYTGSWDSVALYVATGTTAASATLLPGATVIQPSNITYQKLTGSFTPTTTGVYRFAVKVKDAGIPWYLSIDDINVQVAGPPTMLTGTKTNISSTGATLAGTIVADGGALISASGVVVSTSATPVRGGFGVIDSATVPVATSGSYAVNVGGLANGTTYYYRAYAVNSIGTSYGADSTFTTNSSAVIPTVTKTAPTNITALAATTGGNITSDGGSTVTASGIVYATTPNPVIGGLGVVDSTTAPLVALGAFTKGLGGLTHSTKYYYRAYATNSVGTGYSVQDSFTTKLVISALPYTENFDNATTPWSSSAVGTGSNSWVRGTPAKTFLSGAFSAPNAWVTGLTGNYLGTENCAVVSPQFDFSAQTTAPILRFKHKMDVDADLGYDGGFVEISINGGAWTKLDPVVGTGGNFNTANSTSWYNDNTSWAIIGPPMFSANTATSYSSQVNGWITSITPLTGAAGQSNVKIRFRFGADGLTDEGWAIDNIEVFTPAAPTLLTGTKTNITTSSATLAGNITNNGGNAVTASGVVISTSATPVRGGFGVIDSATNPLVGTGAFTVNIAGLTSATTYYYRSYAVNSIGTSYGADSTFTTNSSAVVPTVLRTVATNVQAYSATVGGNITSDGGSTVFASGIVYATTPNPALFGTGVVDSTTTPVITTGSFSINPAGLLHSTKYYYRAYATNAIGTAYSVQDSFTTSPVVSIFPYTQNFDVIGLNTGWGSSVVNGTLNNWVLGTPAKTFLSGAFSGTQAWVTKLSGSYDDNHDAAVVSPQFDFSALTAAPILRFKHKFSTETGWDALIVEMSVNGGAWTKIDNNVGTGTNFNTVLSTSWYNSTSTSGPIAPAKFSGATSATIFSSQVNGWITSVTPLIGANGQSNVKIRFRFGSDASGVDDGVSLDNIEVFVPTAPVVATGTKTNITTSSVTLSGNITNNGGNNVTASGVVISTSATPVRGGFGVIDSATNPLIGSGSLSVNVTGLTAATTYYYRAYAVNAVGTSYGADSTFTTNSSAVIPTVLRVAASNLTTTTATFGGNITSDGGSVVLASGVVYSSTNTLPSVGGVGVTDSTTAPLVTLGTYGFNAAGLNHTTKYYFRAYATNAVGTAYSALDSFTTQPIIATLPYVENFDGATTPWTSAAIGTGTVNVWVKGTPAKTFISGAYSAPNAFVTGLTGNYAGTIDCELTSPQFNFSTLTADPILRFRHKMDVDADLGWDGGTIEISTNGGTTWTKLDDVLGSGTNYNSVGSYSWYNDASTSGLGANKYSVITTDYASHVNGWIETATRLTGAAGQSNVKIRFRFWADAFGVDEGWAIDNINIVSVLAPTVAASNVSVTPAATSANVSFTAGNGQGRLVVARLTSTARVAPTDSVLYAASAAYGSTNTTGTGNYIVYIGTGTTVNVTGLTVSTGYTFDVYEFNGKYMHNKFAAVATSTTTTTPVKLLNFVGVKNANDAQLTWVTASERNNRGFNLERSLDGKNFEFVAFLQGKGNSNVKVNYAYTDKAVFANNAVSKVFYRLKQLDVDGKFDYSSIVSVVNQTAKATSVEAYPNPFNSLINVSVVALKASTANVEIFDISGRKLFNNTYEVEEGSNSIAISKLSDLNQGIYFVRVDVDGEVKVIKMIKN